MQLLPQYIEMIAKDPELQGKIAKATGKSVQAVIIWSGKGRAENEPNHDRLIMKPVLQAIMEYTGAPSEESLLVQAA